VALKPLSFVQDVRCKAAVDIDGGLFGSVIQEGMDKPFMFLISRGVGKRGSSNPETRRVAADIRSAYEHLPSAKRQWVFIRGANHFTYSDDGAVRLNDSIRRAQHGFGILELDGRRQLAVATYCIYSFFDPPRRGRRVAIKAFITALPRD
jgi:hypothetical protein